MDSRNSGSLQSSSGDEEHDSGPVDSISALMNSSNKRRAIYGNPLSNPSPMNATNFDHLSNYFDAISRPPPPPAVVHHPPNSLFNLDMSWSKTLRSDPNSSSVDHHMNPAMISSSPNMQSFFGSFTATTAPSPPVTKMTKEFVISICVVTKMTKEEHGENKREKGEKKESLICACLGNPI